MARGRDDDRRIQTIFPVDGCPWAQIWERYFEQGMQRAEGRSIFDFFDSRPAEKK